MKRKERKMSWIGVLAVVFLAVGGVLQLRINRLNTAIASSPEDQAFLKKSVAWILPQPPRIEQFKRLQGIRNFCLIAAAVIFVTSFL